MGEVADPSRGGVDCAFGGFVERVLELGEDLLDRIEVRAAGRREQQARACCTDRGAAQR
jgi:hypothetical protein